MEKFKTRRGGRFNSGGGGGVIRGGVNRRSRGGVSGVGGRGRGRGFSTAVAAAAAAAPSGAAAANYGTAWPGTSAGVGFQLPHHRRQRFLQQQQPPLYGQQNQPPQHRQHLLLQQRQRNQLIRRVWQNRRGRRRSGPSGAVGTASSSSTEQQQLQSSDPLNLRWVAAESQRRQLAGLSPMPGDSALGSPVLGALAGEEQLLEEGDDESAAGAVDAGEAAGAAANPASIATSDPTGSATVTSAALSTSTIASAAVAAATATAPAASGPASTIHRFKRPAGGNFNGAGGGGGGGGRAFFQPIYGNYRAYYGKRLRAGNLNIGRLQDDRLELLQPDWYLGRDVLDIGCNDGILSLKIAETLGVKSMTGVDIDGHLVQRAQRNLRLRVREAEAELRLKRSLAREGYQVESQPDRSGFPYNVFFQTGNYVLDNEEQLAKVEENKYDIIQAFSITKWIHLNWGDRGLKLFFRRAFRELRPDGKLIIEPQPFQTYKKKLLCPEHKRHYASIQMRPEQFRDYLEREVGFAHSLSISEQRQYHGFQRPVLMCTKPTGRTPALPSAPPPPPLPPSQPTSSAQQAAVAMAAVSSAADSPESIRLVAATSPHHQIDDDAPFDESYDLDG